MHLQVLRLSKKVAHINTIPFAKYVSGVSCMYFIGFTVVKEGCATFQIILIIGHTFYSFYGRHRRQRISIQVDIPFQNMLMGRCCLAQAYPINTTDPIIGASVLLLVVRLLSTIGPKLQATQLVLEILALEKYSPICKLNRLRNSRILRTQSY